MIRVGLMALLLMASAAPRAQSLDLGFPDLSKEHKVLAVNLGVMAFITGWGIAKWDYGDRSPHWQNEGWFGQDTKEGGADKFGHLWSTYVVSDGLAALYESWGYDPDSAAFNGALSSFAIMSFMELGDSFSHYGFSYEDFLINTAGSVSSYLLYKYPRVDEKIDLRWEYAPAFDNADFFTDYSHSKYLMALKLDGFESVRESPLRYLEFHLGYYTRGYDDNAVLDERNIYVGIGINLGKVFSAMGCGKLCRVFDYYQTPYTYLPLDHEL